MSVVTGFALDVTGESIGANVSFVRDEISITAQKTDHGWTVSRQNTRGLCSNRYYSSPPRRCSRRCGTAPMRTPKNSGFTTPTSNDQTSTFKVVAKKGS